MTTIHIHSDHSDMQKEITRLKQTIIHKNVLSMFDEAFMLHQMGVLEDEDFADMNGILREILIKIKSVEEY